MNSENIKENMREALRCPISFEKMTDPIITPNGDSYQREFIEKWVREKGTCPITRKIITINQLVPNKALKQYIQATMPTLKPQSLKITTLINNLTNRIFNSSNNISQNTIVPDIVDQDTLSGVEPSEHISDIYDTPIDHDFSYISCEHYKRCILFGYNTLNRINKWNELRNFIVDETGGFQSGYKNDDILYIMTEIENDYQGHSGSSMGLTMRHMHFIAKYGLQAYKDRFII
jgi:hypothetical protein